MGFKNVCFISLKSWLNNCTTRGMVYTSRTMNLNALSMVTSAHQQESHLPIGADQQMALFHNPAKDCSFPNQIIFVTLRVPFTHIFIIRDFFCINFFLFFFVCVGLLTCVWFYFYRFCLAILAQTIIEHKLNPFMYICWFASSHHNIKTQTKDHKFCPWAETQSQTPPSSVRTLPRRSKCVCVCTIQLLLSHTRTNTQRVLSFLRWRRAGGKLPGAFLGGCEGVRAVCLCAHVCRDRKILFLLSVGTRKEKRTRGRSGIPGTTSWAVLLQCLHAEYKNKTAFFPSNKKKTNRTTTPTEKK